MNSVLRGDLVVLKAQCHRHHSHRGLPAQGGGCGEPQAGARKPGRMAWCPRPAPLGTDVCRETFCMGCGGCRRPGEHGLQGREQRAELSTGGGWGPARPPPPCSGLLSVLTPSRRLRRPSGLSSGTSPEVPASLVESWGTARGQHQGRACVLPGGPPRPAPHPFLPLSSGRTGRESGSLKAWCLQTESMCHRDQGAPPPLTLVP